MSPPLELLPLDEWLRLAGVAEPRSHAEGDLLAGEEAGPYFSLVVAGEAEVSWLHDDGTTARLSTIGAGDGFWRDLEIGGPEGGFVIRAHTGCRIIPFTEEGYSRIFAEHPEAGRALARLFTARVRRANALLEQARRRRARQELLSSEMAGYWEAPFIAEAPAMRALRERIRSLAAGPGPVLIEGEYGSGKHLAAAQIHRAAGLPARLFIPFDSATATVDTWEGQLFGQDRPEEFGVIELAEGGTLYLRHCDQLPREAQRSLLETMQTGVYRRAGSAKARPLGCRIVLSTRQEASGAVARGALDAGFLTLLAERILNLPPLRERKRDIPALVDHFVRTYAAQLGAPVDGVTPEAMKVLVAHDYRLANIKELEQAIERAVPLPRERRIEPRHLFLGAPAVALERWRWDLLTIPSFRRLIVAGRHPAILRGAAAVGFALVILLCFLSPPASTLASALVWGAWWPLMFLTFPLLGRSWCTVCPYSTFARLAQRVKGFGLRPPGFLREGGPLLMSVGFLAILWLEAATGMHADAPGTALLMLGMTGLAALTAVVFQRESWCRYLCPLGGAIGVSSMTGAVEVRSNTEVCLTRCKRSECYHGTETAEGCPMFEHLLFMDSNHHCKMCFSCVRTCPYESVAVNLRIPGREIWMLNRKHDLMSLMVFVLLGSALVALQLRSWGIAPDAPGMGVRFAVAHFASPAAVALLLWLPNLLVPRGWRGGWTRLWMTSYAYVPLAVAANAAQRIGQVPGMERLRFTVQAAGRPLFETGVAGAICAGIIILGAVASTVCILLVGRRRHGKDFSATPGFWAAHVVLLWSLAALAL